MLQRPPGARWEQHRKHFEGEGEHAVGVLDPLLSPTAQRREAPKLVPAAVRLRGTRTRIEERRAPRGACRSTMASIPGFASRKDFLLRDRVEDIHRGHRLQVGNVHDDQNPVLGAELDQPVLEVSRPPRPGEEVQKAEQPELDRLRDAHLLLLVHLLRVDLRQRLVVRPQNIHGPQIEGHGTTRNTALKVETW